MKHLQKFESFQLIKEEEGWKENILVGLMSLFGVAGMGQTTDKSDKISFQKTTKYEHTMKNYLMSGWKLDSTQIDTLWKTIQVEKPTTEVYTTKITFNDAQYFQSGRFQLSPEMKDTISSTLNNIAEQGGLITDIKIQSSTDKQGLSSRLQQQLQSLGFTGDNQGLSHARARSISDELKSLGVNPSIIIEDLKWDQGDKEIDEKARYVTISFSYLQTSELGAKPIESYEKPIQQTTYYLSKEIEKLKPETPGIKKVKGGYKQKKSLGFIKDHKRKHIGCGIDCFSF